MDKRQAIFMHAMFLEQGRMALFATQERPLTAGQVDVITHDAIVVAEALYERLDAKYPEEREESYNKWRENNGNQP